MTYERFFRRLETCGGCTGLRNYQQCKFAIVCAYIEKLAQKGVIKSSKDLGYPISGSDLMLNADKSYLSGAAAIKQSIDIPAGIGPCNAD